MNVRVEEARAHYDYHDEYYSINTGAHRKGGVELVTPTLTHHLGLWFPKPVGDDAPLRSVERFGTIVDAYVRAIYREMRKLDGFESNFEFDIADEKVIGLFGGAYRVEPDGTMAPFATTTSALHFALKDAIESDNRILFAKARWAGLDVIVRCEFHSEYFTITRFIAVADLATLAAEVADLEDHLALIASLGTGTGVTSTAISASHLYLYQGFWDRLDRVLFKSEALFAAGPSEVRSRIFADFRGLVLAGNDAPEGKNLSVGSFAAGRDRGRPFDERWPQQRLIPAIWPFLTAKEGLDLKRREFTASFMLGRRAVYITALGPQPPADGGFRCAPLNYFLVVRPMSDWQLGALVDRLHFMGTVRLAALMELPALRKAGANLRDMDQEAEKARKAIEADDALLATAYHKNIVDLLAHKDSAGEPLFWTGLPFRVERSRYYVQRFTDFVPFLGMHSIEGFQQYDHFVKGRLGGVYDYIDRLGRRQERANTSATSIFQLMLLAERAKANKQSAEANLQNAFIAKRSMNISRTIEKLQTKAEIALLGVIVPHYVMDIVAGFQEQYDKGHTIVVKWFVAITLVAVMLSIASFVNYFRDQNREGHGKAATDILVKYFILFVASISITIAVMATVHIQAKAGG